MTVTDVSVALAVLAKSMERRMAQHEEMLSTLVEVSEALEPYVDVKDGGADGPGPNWAMRLKAQVDEAIAQAERP